MSGGNAHQYGQLGRANRLVRPVPDARLADRAANGLWEASPNLSAKQVLATRQRRTVLRGFSCLGIAGVVWPASVLLGLCLCGSALFVMSLALRLFLAHTHKERRSQPRLTGQEDSLLPVYTLLIALKDEAMCAQQLAAAIRALDYPMSKLDVKLLVEAGDTSTQDALEGEVWPAGTELVVVPPGVPQTKPRALNYGLARARGEFIVVYDAEDQPHPLQLRAAVGAFAEGGGRLACVQAPLVGDEAGQGWLSGQWALEYAVQFGAILPAMARLGLPIMLGGTSNHFRRRVLRDAGGWDAWNVTEDADLGLRLARMGLNVGTIQPPTLEMPPQTLGVWVAQRSRWLKGFMQTWLVMMRDPVCAWRELGWVRFGAVQLTLGASILAALIHGPWALWCLACLILPQMQLGAFSGAVCVVSIIGGVLISFRGGRAARMGLLVSLVCYWPLQTLAAWRAVYGLVCSPHFWAKTPHVSRVTTKK